MTEQPDDIAWIPESQMLDFCRLSRSTFHSWKKSGLNIVSKNAAYGLGDLLCLVILRAAREFLSPKKMIAAWRRLESSGEVSSILIAARQLEKGGCFDLLVDTQYGSIEVALSDEELLEAVRNPAWPRTLAVIDLSEPVCQMIQAFEINANKSAKPSTRAPGRPPSAERNVTQLTLRGG